MPGGNLAVTNGANQRKINDSTEFIIENWKKDSIGCLNLRTKAGFEYLNAIMILKDKSLSDISVLLGSPNEIEKSDGSTTLIYWYNSICGNNRIIENTDYCWVELFFKKDTLSDVSFNCK